MQKPPSGLQVITEVPRLLPRSADSHKGTFGRVLVVAGSRGMSGAAALCGSAALRGGAGLVRVAVPHHAWPIVAAANPCLMTAPLPCDNEGRFDLSAQKELFVLAQANDVLALGPGLGRSAALTTLLSSVLKQVKMPIVVDADGLYGFAANASHLPRAAPLILTPHPGEFSRVAGVDVATVQANRRDLAAAFAKEHGVVLLLKGHRTIVTDGNRLYENTTGNPGMATAGSGDVLTGLIAALLAQKLDAFSAAQLGAYVHGLAGDLAKADVGEIGMTASDVLDRLPRALKSVQGQ